MLVELCRNSFWGLIFRAFMVLVDFLIFVELFNLHKMNWDDLSLASTVFVTFSTTRLLDFMFFVV